MEASKSPPLEVRNQRLFKGVLMEAVEKLQLLGLVSSESKNRKRNNGDMHKLLLERSELEQTYERLMRRRGLLKGIHNKIRYQKNQDELKRVAQALRESTQTITESLEAGNNPHLLQNLVKIEKDRYMFESLLRATISEISADGSYNALEQQVDSQLGELQMLSSTKFSRARVFNDLSSLEREIKREMRTFESDLKKRKADVVKLTREFQELREESELTLKYEADTAAAAAATRRRLNKRVTDKLDAELAEVRKALNRDSEVTSKTMTFLKDRQSDMGQKVEEWKRKYKLDYKAATTKYGDLKEKRDLQKVLLDELRERKEEMKKLDAMLVEAQKKKEVELSERRRKEMARYKAAAKIRFFWDVFWKQEGAKLGKKKKGKKKKK